MRPRHELDKQCLSRRERSGRLGKGTGRCGPPRVAYGETGGCGLPVSPTSSHLCASSSDTRIPVASSSPSSGSTRRVALTRRPVHIPDVESDPDYTYPAEQRHYRTLLPILVDDERTTAKLGRIWIQPQVCDSGFRRAKVSSQMQYLAFGKPHKSGVSITQPRRGLDDLVEDRLQAHL